MCIEAAALACGKSGRGISSVRQRGLTLIELIVFIVVVSIGLAGILGVLDFTNRASVNPMLFKQQVAIAEALLEEVSSKPFTWCDPDDANAASASSAADCAVPQELTQTAGEDRYSQTQPFDNVGDYNDFAMSAGILAPTDSSVTLPGLGGYTARVRVSQAGAALGLADDTAALRIEVSVGAPGQAEFVLTGYRLRHAPRQP